MLEETYLPSKYGYVTEEDLSGSVYAILRSHGTDIVHATRRIEICYANERESKLLDVREKQPLLLHHDLAMDEQGNEVLFSKLVINSELYTLTIMM